MRRRLSSMLAAPEQRSANQTVILPSKSCQAPAIESWQAGFSHRNPGTLGHRILAGRLQPSNPGRQARPSSPGWQASAIEILAGPSDRILAGRPKPSNPGRQGSAFDPGRLHYFCTTRLLFLYDTPLAQPCEFAAALFKRHVHLGSYGQGL